MHIVTLMVYCFVPLLLNSCICHFCSTNPRFVSVEFHGDHKTVTLMRYNLATLSFGDVTRFKTVQSVCDVLTVVNVFVIVFTALLSLTNMFHHMKREVCIKKMSSVSWQ